MIEFQLEYIDRTHPYYADAIQIRKEQFFKDMSNSEDLINDAYENKGIHLVCLHEGNAIGTGRLNCESKTGVISQMAVNSNYQNKGVGRKILNELLRLSKEKDMVKVVLSARETAIGFYGKFDFKVVGAKYPSLKTGITHQKMERIEL